MSEFVYYILMENWESGYAYNLGAYATRTEAEAAYEQMKTSGKMPNGGVLQKGHFVGILKAIAGDENLFDKSGDFAATATPPPDYVAPNVFTYSIEMRNWAANFGYDLGTYPTRAAAKAAYERMKTSGKTPRGATLRQEDFRGIIKHGRRGREKNRSTQKPPVMTNRTVAAMVKKRDWEGIAEGFWDSTGEMHGLPTLSPEQRRYIEEEAAKDGYTFQD